MPFIGKMIRSQHNHNNSLLPSNKPKFKENIRENIYKDEIQDDGVLFDSVSEEKLNTVLESIRLKAKYETIKEIKILILSIIITLLITFLFIERVEKEIKHRRMENLNQLN